MDLYQKIKISEIQSFFTLTEPEPVYPPNNAINVADWPMIFEWACDGDPDEYRLYLQQQPFGGGDITANELRVTIPRGGPKDEVFTPTVWQAPTNLKDVFIKWPQANTTYNWKVVAVWYKDDEATVSEELPIASANQWTYRSPPYGYEDDGGYEGEGGNGGDGGDGKGIYWLNLAINPTPIDTDTSVAVGTENVTWEDGGGAVTFDVYFDTRDNYLANGGELPLIASNVAVASPMAIISTQNIVYTTTYVWRVNPKNAWFTREGTLWDFTTLEIGSGTGIPWPDGAFANRELKLIAAADDAIWYEE